MPTRLETTVHVFLDELEIPYETEVPLHGCVNLNANPYRFDVCFRDEPIFIEIDGPHHFTGIYPGQNLFNTIEDDVYKMNRAAESGYSVIRITFDAIEHSNWKGELAKAISACRASSVPIRRYINYQNYETLRTRFALSNSE